jgi:SAM-dependent methyltransferase
MSIPEPPTKSLVGPVPKADSSVAARYDQLAYQSAPIGHAHPQRMAALLHLMGLTVPEPSTARILELGCGTGANVLSLAAILPKASLVGIDLSSSQIASAERIRGAAGLTNVQLLCQDFSTLDSKFGTFDYIIAHGIYSWVAPPLQQKMLALCAQHLSAHGAAYISFNCLPGWHLRGIVRDAMLFASKDAPDLRAQIAQSRSALELLGKSLTLAPSPSVRPAREEVALRIAIAHEFGQAAAMPDWYLAHDFLSVSNNALYFSEFYQQLQKEKLQYVGDLELAKNFPLEQPAEVQKVLASIGDDRLRYEQYLDFLRTRFFRRALIVRQSAVAALRPLPSRIEQLYLSTNLRPIHKPDALLASQPIDFQAPTGAALRTQDALLSEAILRIASMGNESCTSVLAAVLQKVPPEQREGKRAELLQNLGRLWLSELLHAEWGSSIAASTLPTHPRASALARAQAKNGPQVSTLRHEQHDLSTLALQVLDMLDGGSATSDLCDVFGPLALSLGHPNPEQAFEHGLRQLLELGLIYGEQN